MMDIDVLKISKNRSNHNFTWLTISKFIFIIVQFLTYVRAFSVYGLSKEFDSSHVVTSHQYPRRLFEALLDQRQRYEGSFREVAAGLLLPVIRVKVQVSHGLRHPVSCHKHKICRTRGIKMSVISRDAINI